MTPDACGFLHLPSQQTILTDIHPTYLGDIIIIAYSNMKLTFAAALLALPLALAESLKSVVITFPKGTPDSVIIQAKESLVASVRSASLLQWR